jgi:hypothetical protein
MPDGDDPYVAVGVVRSNSAQIVKAIVGARRPSSRGSDVGVTPEILLADAELGPRDRNSLSSATERALPHDAWRGHAGVVAASLQVRERWHRRRVRGQLLAARPSRLAPGASGWLDPLAEPDPA